MVEEDFLNACDLCGASAESSCYLFTKYDSPVVQCNECELLYVNPRVKPDILWQRYSDTYFQTEYLPQHGEYDEQRNYQTHAHLLDELASYAPNRGRLLDIGCAIGLFLAAARMDGWAVLGNELNRFAAEYATRKFGIPVLPGNVDDLNLKRGSFDAVTLWDTLEHLLSPRAAIRKAAELLKPGGVLALSTPNVGGITYSLLRERWWIIAPREHLFYFSPRTITRLLNDCGFEIRKL